VQCLDVVGVIKLETITRKASDCTTGPKMSQQANEKLARAVAFCHWRVSSGNFAIGEIFR